jgi:endonuclease YncB( thermonuclease family)
MLKRHLLALFLIVIAAIPASAHSPRTITGRVVSIADGATLTVLDEAKSQHKIRLHGIDAREKGQAFGTKSRENLAALTFGKEVRVEVVDVDRYHREVDRVFVPKRSIRSRP